MAHVEEKMTVERWPSHPETASMEGKNKLIGFWVFLGEKQLCSHHYLQHT